MFSGPGHPRSSRGLWVQLLGSRHGLCTGVFHWLHSQHRCGRGGRRVQRGRVSGHAPSPSEPTLGVLEVPTLGCPVAVTSPPRGCASEGALGIQLRG